MGDCKQGPVAKFKRDPYPSFTFDAGFDILKIFSGSILVNANKNVGFEANLKGKLLGVLEAEGDLKVSPEGLAVKLHVKAGGIVKMLTDAAKAGGALSGETGEQNRFSYCWHGGRISRNWCI